MVPSLCLNRFENVCAMLYIKRLDTTIYHPETTGQAERYNRTLDNGLRHFVAEHQRNWHEFIEPLTYAYNSQVHRSLGVRPFELVLS